MQSTLACVPFPAGPGLILCRVCCCWCVATGQAAPAEDVALPGKDAGGALGGEVPWVEVLGDRAASLAGASSGRLYCSSWLVGWLVRWLVAVAGNGLFWSRFGIGIGPLGMGAGCRKWHTVMYGLQFREYSIRQFQNLVLS